MRHHRANARRILEARLAGLGERIGVPPPGGWMSTMRRALGMSTYQLGRRMGFSPTRIRQFEAEEVSGAIRLGTLRRAAEAMNCTLVYALAPNEPLEDIVLRQAHVQAARHLDVLGPRRRSAGDPELDLVPPARLDELEDLTIHYVDHRDLWR